MVGVVCCAIGVQLVLPQSASADPLTWVSRASMPTGRGLGSVTVANGKIYILGSTSDYFNNLSAVEAYNPATSTWQARASLLQPRQRAAAATIDGKIYLIGGRTPGTDTVATVEEYDPNLDTWNTKSDAPIAAIGSSAVTANGQIYLFGGYPGCCFSYLNAVRAYDPITDTWTSRASMPTAREGSAAALAPNGKIYVLGGNGNGDTWRVMEEYDPVANTWAVRTPAPIDHSYGSLVTGADGKLYLFGAFSGATTTVLQYDPSTDTWATSTTIPTARASVMAADPGDGKIYVIGGSDPNTPWPFTWLATNEALTVTGSSFNFSGFQQPVDNPPTVNLLKAGAAASTRVMAAYQWGSAAAQLENRWSDAAEGFETAITLLPLVVWHGQLRTDSEFHLTRLTGLASDAAASAISAERLERAIELLEQGRAVLWSRLLDDRADLKSLHLVEPDLARKLDAIRVALDERAGRP